MKVIQEKNLGTVLQECVRPSISQEQIVPVIDEIFSEVKSKGDLALKKYTHFFDRTNITSFQVAEAELKNAANQLSSELKSAIQIAKQNIEVFHRSQKAVRADVETMQGVRCWQEVRPIERIGIYIPGGSAPLFSTVLMLAVPALIAGCKEVILCTPPNSEGNIDPAILYAANITDVSKVYKVGGAQAIAAMTFGTESIPSVYKIFGPGNQYVTCAKMRAQQFGVAIDMPAGPSELLLLADDSAEPAFVASDLLSQAEHGADSQVICIVDTENLAKDILMQIELQLNALPRKEIAEAALRNSKIIISPNLDFTLGVINDYGPEHLILCTNQNESIIPRIVNAGSVFIGNYTPESAGDYASGTNHTLPTGGNTKAYSGVNMDAFTKKITFQEISKEGMSALGQTIEVMAEAEQLQAHKNAVTLRLNTINQ